MQAGEQEVLVICFAAAQIRQALLQLVGAGMVGRPQIDDFVVRRGRTF